MPAFVIVDIDVQDPVGYEDYKKLAPSSIAAYGGKYLARGGKTDVVEGSWKPSRLVILEFPSFEQAKKWIDSPEYADAKKLRHKYAKTNMVVVEGL